MEQTVAKTAAKKRIFYFDIIRAFACVCVIIIHATGFYYSQECGSVNYWTGNICSSFVRMAVPLFVMLTGALMLDEKYECSDKKLIGHIVRIILFFIFWSFAYATAFYVILPLINGRVISLETFVDALIRGHYHLWFCYMIVGIYLIIPLMRVLAKKANKKQVEYFIIISVIFGYFIPTLLKIGAFFLPFFNTLTIANNMSYLNILGGYTAYLLAGWYLHNFEFKHKKALYIGGAVSVIVSIIGEFILFKYKNIYEFFYEPLSLHIFIQSCAVFVYFKEKYGKLEFNKNNKIHLLISNTSKHSLGIYAIHVVILIRIDQALKLLPFDIAILNIPVSTVVAFVVSYFLSWLMSKIPFFKRFV